MQVNRIATVLIGLIVAVGVVSPAPAYADTTATIHGVITMPDGTVPDVEPSVIFCGSNDVAYGCGALGQTFTYTLATGAYSFTGLSAGQYQIEFRYEGANPSVLGVFWNGDSLGGPYTQVAAGANITANVKYIAAATISGHVTSVGGPVTNGTVTATRDGTPYPWTAYVDVATQTYSFTRLPAGDWRIEFYQGPYAPTYWQGKNSLASATPITLVAGQAVTGIDAVLGATTSISGHLFMDDGSGPAPRSGHVDLVPVPATGASYRLTSSDAVSGAYTFDNMEAGTYRVCAEGSGTIIAACWGGGTDTTAPTITVSAGDAVTGKDMTVTVGGVITATVKTAEELGGPTTALGGAAVDLWRLNDAGTVYDFFKGLTADTSGAVEAEQIPAGTYRVEFRDPAADYSSQWWNNKRYFGEADEDIIVAAGQTVALGEAVLLPRTFDVSRTYDQDRFSGAVQMTQAIWPPAVETPDDSGVPAGGVPVIYIANGLNYPDALSAGPAAIVQQGALLLVWPTSIPDVVAAELHRLMPRKIVIVGGPASVSDDVMHQLAAFVPDPSDVTRQNGTDRFAASRNLAWSVWGDAGAPTVFISTGLNFPDALDAGPAAGLIDAPVILVNGSLSTLDADTAQLLDDLGTTDVYIAGGPGSVSPGIEAALSTKMGGPQHVHRFTGETRYEAAAAINEWFFPTTETAFLATGANFPDALAGAPLAGAVGGPIYLSQPDCIPQLVAQQINDGDTQAIWLLGGPASISPAVEGLHVCAS